MKDLKILHAIPGWEDYSINKLGEIYSEKVKRYLTVNKNSNGYYQAHLTDSSSRTKFILLHRLLAFVFLGLPSLEDLSLEVHHIDEDTSNNSLDNLEVLTKEQHLNITTKNKNTKICPVCGGVKSYRANTCRTCLLTSKGQGILGIEDIVLELLESKSWLGASRVLGLSDVGLRKIFDRQNKNPKVTAKTVIKYLHKN